ncbi:MBL fold metallo-hydrolase [Candidatus Peregrinibacteria bacterium]|nr:MBL fold metallo-hydrolase [Candidatus Peregrinibacteria bacterium]
MRKRVWLLICICFALVGICSVNLPRHDIQLSFLDVGQGDSIFIRTPDDYVVLIDGGPTSSVVEELAAVLPRYSRRIDILVLTHPHADHVNGLVEVVKRFDIGKVILVGTPSSNTYYQEFLHLCDVWEIPIYYAQAHHDVKIGSFLYLDIVWPFHVMAGKSFENLNNASLAMRIITPRKVVMLTGDAETEEEHEMLESGFDLSAHILKAGHHGSKTASCDEFLDAVKPKTVVIQSGANNSFGHPHKKALEKFVKKTIKVRRNDMEGRIEFML